MSEILLDDYNCYRLKTNHVAQLRASGKCVVTLKATKERLRAFEKMHEFCKGEGIESRHWLYSLFVTRHWMFSPPIKHLCSLKHLAHYRGTDYGDGYRRRIEGAGVPVWDPRKDISRAVELLKARFLTQETPGRCMERMDSETFGYHPKSSWCGQCPIAIACEAQLRGRVSYDITALRRGDFTVDQALSSVVYRGGR